MADKHAYRIVALRVIERIYFNLYAMRVMSGQMPADKLQTEMEKALAAFDESLVHLENGSYPLEATKVEVEREKDWGTELQALMERANG